jgi:hypothetical protein
VKNHITIEKVNNGFVIVVNDYACDLRKKQTYICDSAYDVRERIKVLIEELYAEKA